MQSYQLDVEGLRIHLSKRGEGPVIFLLHASPLSSKSLLPLADLLSNHFTVIAPDTPGYGRSEAPKEAPNSIAYYARIVKGIALGLGISSFSIYGTATGAQIAIRYALEYPSDIQYLFLDNTAHFDASERNEILEHYFPDFSPCDTGQHTQKIWDTVGHLFEYFPWCFQEEKYKLPTPSAPLPVLHMVAIEYLTSGKNYDWAYRAAFVHEDKKHIYALKVPTLIFRWTNSILKPYTDRLFQEELPANIEGLKIEADTDRYLAMTNAIENRLLPNAPLSPIRSESLIPYKNSMNKDALKMLPKFPPAEHTGKYWLVAWTMLDEYIPIEISQNLQFKNDLLVKWAQMN